jgi:uncharacterized protein YcbX
VEVAELWRFPVKSLGGERLQRVAVGPGGLEGDRGWAIWDLRAGLGLTARRVPELLFASASFTAPGNVEITLPDGQVAADDGALSRWLGRPVELRDVAAGGNRRYEDTTDPEREADAPWQEFTGADGPFHDSSQARVTLLSTGSFGDWDRRRFRANVILAGAGEDHLVGERIALGETVLAVRQQIGRCVMTTRAQPGGLERDLSVLRRIARERDGKLAVGALVERGGMVQVGDRLDRRA